MKTIDLPDQPTQALAVRETGGAVGILRPADSLDRIAEAFKEYQAVCERILTKDDYQEYEGKKRKKKSAWRKLAVSFNVSTMVVKEDVVRDDKRHVLAADFTIRAYTGPKDNPYRQWESAGHCDINEKCCANAEGNKCHKASWKKRDGSPAHYCCQQGCDGRKHWTHPDHDVISTAQTRASNRAVADLIGCGEVSAEELTDDGGAEPGNSRSAPASSSAPASRAAASSPKPAKSAKPAETYPLENTRAWMLKRFEGQEDFFVKLAWILPTETIQDINGMHVPINNDQCNALLRVFQAFQDGEQIGQPYPPNADNSQPPKSEKKTDSKPAAAPAAATKTRDPEWFWDVIVSVPRAGMKKTEYEKDPDTIGSLYDLAKGGDEDARKRLFGLANKWDAAPREYNGRVYQPSKADVTCREALDAFIEWEQKHKDKVAAGVAAGETPQDVPAGEAYDPDDQIPF